MPCFSCGDREPNACGCLPACLGRRREPQRPRTSTTEHAEQDRGSISMVQMTRPVPSRVEPDHHRAPREPSGRQSVSSTSSTAGSHGQASPRGEANPRDHRADSARQGAFHLWPRTTQLEYNAGSVFATQATVSSEHKRGAQQDSPSGPPGRQLASSAGRGQSPRPSGEINRRPEGAVNAPVRPVGQQVTNIPHVSIEPVTTGRPTWLSFSVRPIEGYSIEVGVEAAIFIGPKRGHIEPVDKFVVDMARYHNREIPSQHSRMSERLFEHEDGPPRNWFIISGHARLTTNPLSRERVPIHYS